MQIGFFASSFANRYGSGTAKHIEKVARIFCTDYNSKLEVTFFCNNQEQYLYLNKDLDFRNSKIIFLPKVRGKLFKSSRQYFKYALKTKQIQIDVLHFSVARFYPLFWFFPARKFVCTFHAGGDITAEKDRIVLSREVYNLTAKLFFKRLDAIIAVSEFGRNEISQAYGIEKELISVIHGGTDDMWQIQSKVASKYAKKGKKLIVVLGRWQKYKNVQLVSKALSEANSSDLNEYYFIFIGKKISLNAKTIEQQLNNVDDQAYETFDYLDEKSYADIIREADLVIVPSLNEGFSHPIFDAFSLGARVLLHSPSPAAQILENRKGVFAVNLNSSSDLFNLISNAIQSPKGNPTQNRVFLKSIGATWASTAESYAKVYESLLK